MNLVKKLVLKDWHLQRSMILLYFLGGILALGVICLGGQAAFTIGLILIVTVLIALGAQLATNVLVYERRDQTLPFVMSLPISFRDYTLSKLLAAFGAFLAIWLFVLLAACALFAVPHGVPHGLFPFTAVMSGEILVTTCLTICVALVTESQKWTITAIMIGNIGLNIIGYGVAHLREIARGMDGHSVMWSATASILLLVEVALIVAFISLALFLQSRKRSFL